MSLAVWDVPAAKNDTDIINNKRVISISIYEIVHSIITNSNRDIPATV